jgi:hypothetical protein
MSVYQRPPNYYFLPKAQQEEIDRKIYEQKVADGVLSGSGMFSYAPSTGSGASKALAAEGKTPESEIYYTPEELAARAEEEEKIRAEKAEEAKRVSERMAIAAYEERRKEEDFENLFRSGEFEQGDYEERKEEYFETDRPDKDFKSAEENLNYREKILNFNDVDNYFDKFSDEEEIYSVAAGELITRRDDALLSTYTSPDSLGAAKERADYYYIQSLEKSLEKATTAEEKKSLKELIDKGAPNFDTIEDIKNWESLESTYKNKDSSKDFSVERAEYDALDMQKTVMAEFVTQPAGGGFSDFRREYGGNFAYRAFTLPKDESGNTIQPEYRGDVRLNTGTAYNQISSSVLEDKDSTIGGFGETTYVLPEFEEPSKLQQFAQPLGLILSAIFPPAAPIIMGVSTTIATDGDIEEGIKSGLETYVTGKITDITKDQILDAYEAADIPVRELDLYTQSKLVEVTNDVLAGKSGTESAESAVKSIIWKNLKETASEEFPEGEGFDFDFDFDLSGINIGGFDLDLFDDIKGLDFSGLDLPDFDISVPDVKLPDIDIDIPDVDLDMPDFDLNVPDINLSGPDINLSGPDINLSGIDLNLPDIDLDGEGLEMPDFDLDTPDIDINIPDIDLPSLNLALSLAEEEEEETEVEQLFSDELFKYDTKIGYTMPLTKSKKTNSRKFI